MYTKKIELVKNLKATRIVFFIMLIIGIIGSTYAGMSAFKEVEQNEYTLNQRYEAHLTEAITSAVLFTDILDTVICNHGGEISQEEFESIAKTISDSSFIHAVSYAPQGIVTHRYPLNPNNPALNVNFFEDEHTKASVLLAYETQQPVISGPFNLLINGFGITIRNPIFKEGEFIGIVSVAMLVDELIKHIGLSTLVDIGYEYRLSTTYQGEKIVATESEAFTPGVVEADEFDVAGAYMSDVAQSTWRLTLYDNERYIQSITYGLFWFFAVLAVNLFIFYFLRKAEKHREKIQTEMETDPLTGISNRLKLENFLHDVSGALSFGVFFIDLNKFKPVNDTYGHDTGDQLLIAYSKRLKENSTQDTLVARLGGDEFVLVAPNVSDEKTAKIIATRIKDLSEQTFSINEISINISASIGWALSSERDSPKTLLEKADAKMYEQKSKNAKR